MGSHKLQLEIYEQLFVGNEQPTQGPDFYVGLLTETPSQAGAGSSGEGEIYTEVSAADYSRQKFTLGGDFTSNTASGVPGGSIHWYANLEEVIFESQTDWGEIWAIAFFREPSGGEWFDFKAFTGLDILNWFLPQQPIIDMKAGRTLRWGPGKLAFSAG